MENGQERSSADQPTLREVLDAVEANRQEVLDAVEATRTEMKAEIAELRTEVGDGFERIADMFEARRKDIESLKGRVTKLEDRLG